MKKNLMLAIVAVMTATVLAGCGTDSTASKASSEPVQVEQAAVTDDTDVQADEVEEKTQEAVEEVAEESKSEMTLEKYFEDNNLKATFDAEINSMKEANKNAYGDIAWRIDENVLTYEYTYLAATEIDDEGKEYLDTTFQTTANGILPGMIKEAGIEDIGIRYIFNNPDGSLIYDETFYVEK